MPLPPLSQLLSTLPALSREELVQLLATTTGLREAILVYLQPHPARNAPVDTLLNVTQAAQRLGVKDDFLYQHKHNYPFYVRLGGKVLFSAQGIQDWITGQQGVHNGTQR